MATIKFYLNPRKRKDDTHALKLAVHMNRTTQRKDIGIEIPKKLWNDAKQQILGDFNGISKLALNNALQKHRINATEKLFQLSQTGEIASITAKQFCKELYNSCPTSPKQSFQQYFKEYITRLEDIGKIGNAKANKYAYDSFTKHYKDDLSFEQVNYQLIKKLDESLIKQGLSVNGRATIHRAIRALYNFAAKELEYVSKSSNPYLDFQVLHEKTKKRNISIDDVRKIYNYQGQHQMERDMFIFAFLCIGMDIVDICHLKPENIVKGRLEYARKKVTRTQRFISIKIEKEIQQILNRYQSKSYLFPFLEGCASDEERYLKHTNIRRLLNKKYNLIAEELGIESDITTKVSRHSWATIARKLGFSKDLISEMLGHKAPGVAVTDIYVDDFDFEVKDACNHKVIEAIVSKNQ